MWNNLVAKKSVQLVVNLVSVINKKDVEKKANTQYVNIIKCWSS